MALSVYMACNNCFEKLPRSRTASLFWYNLCWKCILLGPFKFIRRIGAPWKRDKKTVEPDCEHEWVDWGLIFCTEPKLIDQVCPKCHWRRFRTEADATRNQKQTKEEADGLEGTGY